ncbi:MAG: hypothetical protein HGA39_00315 [Coriobacteriia bacterium]|nr:hypothetical protein [Coriobacteriia bacterium]
MIPEPYRVFAFLVGLAFWLVMVVAVTVAYGLLGRPEWLRVVMTLLPLLVVLIAWVTLALSWASMLSISAIAVGLVFVVHLFLTKYLGLK